jgi:transposase
MLIVFFDIRGIVHHEFVLEGQTVNAEFYCNVLRRLRKDIRRKRPELWRAGNWLLHDDNAPSHRALVTHEFLTHKGIITLPYPPYSPDLAPCNFFLFPKMKLQLKVRRFDRVEKIQKGISECSWYASRTGLPARVSPVTTELGSMRRCTRGLF